MNATKDTFAQKHRLLFWVLILSTVWAVYCGAVTGLSDQEAYYWTWSRVLDWCYFEHPALQAWLTRALTWLFGNHPVVVRLPASLLGRLIGLYFYYRWLRLRFSPQTSEISMFLLLSTFFMIAGSLIALPDSLLFPFICMALYFSESKNAWGAGLAIGLAGLAKWTGAFVLPGMIAAFLSGDTWRKKIKNLFILLSLGALLQAPTFYWNAQHDWASFRFHLQNRHPQFTWSFKNVLQNLSAFGFSQICLGGIGFVLLLYYYFKTRKRRAHESQEPKLGMPLNVWIWPAFLVVGLSAVRGEMRFYWTAPAFLVLIPLLVERVLGLDHSGYMGRQLKRASLFALSLSFTLLSCALFAPVGEWVRPLVETYREYDIRFSPRGDIEGWRQVIEQQKQEGLWVEGRDYALVASNFRLSSQVAWASNLMNMAHVYVASPVKSQFGNWSSLQVAPFPQEAFFFRDNRHPSREGFDRFCRQGFSWQSYEYKLRGAVIKIIWWAHCPDFVHDPN